MLFALQIFILSIKLSVKIILDSKLALIEMFNLTWKLVIKIDKNELIYIFQKNR